MDQSSRSPSIAEIENLILSLYQPSTPEAIAATQTTLTQLHKLPQAWSIARDLLARYDEKVKFHGALIIIVKLNTESSSLGQQDAKELLMNLLGWYLESCSQGNSPLVTRKLSSALATFLIHFHRLWGNYVRHLLQCLASRQVYDPSTVDDSVDLNSIIAGLQPAQIRAALWVVNNVMDDAARVDLNTEQNIALYDVVRQNTSDAVSLMAYAFSSQPLVPQLLEDSTKCLQAWIWFTQKSSRDKHLVDSLRPLVTVVISSLGHENAQESAAELIADVLSNYSSLLTEQHYHLLANLLASPWSQSRYEALIGGDFEFEYVQYGQLLLAFGDARVEVLMRTEDDRSRSILSCLCGLLAAEGYPAVEDKIFVPALEFWSTYTETVTDELYSDEDAKPHWGATATSFVLQAVSNAWEKIAYPPPEQYSQWDTSERVGFNDARKDVADLLLSTFTLSGPQLVFTFAELTLNSLSSSSWMRLEAAAFCLGAVADCVRDNTQCDDALQSVFSSSLFDTIRTDHAQIPMRVRQTCVSLIEHYTEFFERNVSHLPSALNLLFGLLGDPILASPASKSIQRLCSSCRRHLHQDIEAFLGEYRNLASTRKVDCISSEKVLWGVACVAQAVPDEARQLAAFDRIIAVVEEDVQCALELTNNSAADSLPCPAGSRCRADTDDEHPALHVAMRAMKSLASIGRGLQSPVDAQFDLDGDLAKPVRGEMVALQKRVLQAISQTQETFGSSAEITETICSIFRCGFSETEPGPFVFSPEDVTNFLTRHSSESPRIGALVKTACSFVSSLRHLDHWNQQQYLTTVLLWVTGLAQQLSEPEADPELTQNAIDFACRVVTKSPMTLIQLQPPEAGEFFFMFTMRVLDGKEPLPKASAADFWTTFAMLKSTSTELEDANRQAMNTLGPMLCQSLARNIGGNALRSELDKLSDPLKKLIIRYPQTKMWLESALNHPTFPSSKINQEQKSMFVKKLISLRGARGTNQVVRDFWLAAKGSSFSYAS